MVEIKAKIFALNFLELMQVFSAENFKKDDCLIFIMYSILVKKINGKRWKINSGIGINEFCKKFRPLC